MPEAARIGAHFCLGLETARAQTSPYRHWLLRNILPENTCAQIDTISVQPRQIADTQGRRETHNSTRLFFGVAQQARHKVCADLAAALQSRKVTGAIEALCDVDLRGSSLRIEYCLDTSGFWLEPHTDIGAKFFTLLIYLSDSPEDEDWGTDIYASRTDWVTTAPCARNRGLIFVPADNTWHGFRPRPITGVRRSLIVNYVTPEWRARHELAFPETPIG